MYLSTTLNIFIGNLYLPTPKTMLNFFLSLLKTIHRILPGMTCHVEGWISVRRTGWTKLQLRCFCHTGWAKDTFACHFTTESLRRLSFSEKPPLMHAINQLFSTEWVPAAQNQFASLAHCKLTPPFAKAPQCSGAGIQLLSYWWRCFLPLSWVWGDVTFGFFGARRTERRA